ncbi:MAG: GspMb/PilO family protein [Candidatus Brocadiia bacterium]
MKLSKREKTTLVLGSSIALAVALTAWVLLPLHRRWTDLGRQLQPGLRALETVQERAERQRTLLAQRQRLIRELGWLVEPEPEPQEEEGQEKQKSGPEGLAEKRPPKTAPDDAAPVDTGAGAAVEPVADEPVPSGNPGQPDQTAEGSEKESEESEQPEASARKPKGYELETEVERMFKECGAGLKLLSAKRLSRLGLRPEHYEMVGLQVETETKIDSLIKVLHRIEKGPRFIRIDRLKLRHDPKKPLAVVATMELVAYQRVDGN